MLRLVYLAAALLLTLQTSLGVAQLLPSKPIRLVVPSAPGGTLDLLARAAATCMKENLRTELIVDNRPGAAGSLSVAEIVGAPSNEQTILLAPRTTLIALAAQKFNAVSNLETIALIADAPLVLVVPSSSQLRTLADVVNATRKPNGLSIAGATGTGLDSEIASMLGIPARSIPVKSFMDAYAALNGGQADIGLFTVRDVRAEIESGRVRAIATTGVKRTALLPNVPSVVELGRPRESTFVQQYFFYTRKGTDGAVVSRLRSALIPSFLDGRCGNKDLLWKLGIDPGTVFPQVPNPCGTCDKTSCTECGKECCPK